MDYSEMTITDEIRSLVDSCSDPDYLREKFNTYYPPVPVWVGPPPKSCQYILNRGLNKGLACGRKCSPGECYCHNHRRMDLGVYGMV